MRKTPLAASIIAALSCTCARAEQIRYDTTGVAATIFPDLFANHPAAQRLDLRVEAVRPGDVLPAPESDACLVEVTTNLGVMKFKLRYNGATGSATPDLQGEARR